MEQTAYLALENGAVFPGNVMGAAGEVTGEVVFTTGMTGYLETLTDPSYFGQIVVQAFPLIGNYGVIPNDFESPSPHLRGYIVHEWCQAPSNFRSEGSLDAFLKREKVVGLCGVDTRAIIQMIREEGTMNGRIVLGEPADLPRQTEEAAAFRIENAVERVSAKQKKTLEPSQWSHHVVLWDFGAKKRILDQLMEHGCKVTVVPHNTTCEEILALKPDGVMLSNGPGNPADNEKLIAQVGRLAATDVPVFGICLGHQLLALAHGAKTRKLHYGHRGANQPVRDLESGRVYITSQNHGYAVMEDSLPQNARVRMVNVNDGTCEGLDYLDQPAFSVQFHPEGCGGPQDTQFLFERFTSMMNQGRN